MAKTLGITQLNQSTGAKRTISNMAKAMRLDAEWLHTLLSLHWNYDKKGREAMGWVELETDDALQSVYEKVLSVFRLPETPISPNEAAEAVLHTLSHTDETALLHRFAAAAKRGDFAVVQEFRTYHYHRNATAERLLKVWDKPLTAESIAGKLFFPLITRLTPMFASCCPCPTRKPISSRQTGWGNLSAKSAQHTPKSRP